MVVCCTATKVLGHCGIVCRDNNGRLEWLEWLVAPVLHTLTFDRGWCPINLGPNGQSDMLAPRLHSLSLILPFLCRNTFHFASFRASSMSMYLLALLSFDAAISLLTALRSCLGPFWQKPCPCYPTLLPILTLIGNCRDDIFQHLLFQRLLALLLRDLRVARRSCRHSRLSLSLAHRVILVSYLCD